MVLFECGCLEPEKTTVAFKDASVTVLQVLTPVSFVIKEMPGPEMSPSGRAYLFLSARMRKLFKEGAAEPVGPQPPLIGSVVLGKKPEDGQWHRARINRVFDTSEGFQAQISLVDFGEKIIVPFSALCKLPSEAFPSEVPFQCVRFSLHGLKCVRSADGSGPCSVWDIAAKEFVEDALAGCSSIVQVRATGEADSSGELCGQLYIEGDDRPVSLAEELVKRGYATWDRGGERHAASSALGAIVYYCVFLAQPIVASLFVRLFQHCAPFHVLHTSL